MSTNKQAEVLILELTDRRNSGYVREGTERTAYPIFLDAPSYHRIKNTSVVQDKDGNYRAIRYIAGASTIFVDEQEQKNIKPNPIEDAIWFRNGALTAVRMGREVALYDFLKACEFNESNENRPDTAQTIFRQVDTEGQAEKSLASNDLKMEAFELTRELSSKGPNGYEYNEGQIEYYCALFNIVGMDGPAQKTMAIIELATQRPKHFLDVVGSKRSAAKVQIANALQFQVISITGEHAAFTSSQFNFYKFKSTTKDAKVEELVDYLQSKKGNKDYETMLALTQQAQADSVNTKKAKA